jgi:hypothetical protein
MVGGNDLPTNVVNVAIAREMGWAMWDHMRAELTVATLTMAIQQHKPPPELNHGPSLASTNRLTPT